MSRAKTKQVTLRAFSIKSTVASVNTRDIIEKLRERLKESKVKGRQMVLSSEDPSGEHDVMSNFSFSGDNMTGTIMRIIPQGHNEHITADLFEKETFSIEEIKKTYADGASIYKKHVYICINGENLITDLHHPNTIKSIETYINWLLSPHIFEFLPIIMPAPDMKLSEIKNVTFTNPAQQLSLLGGKSYSFLSREQIGDILNYLLGDTRDIKEIEFEQIVSAKLLLKFTKPRGMREEEYERHFAALLKPVADLENVSFGTKNGKKISSETILHNKKVSIDLTGSGFISEQQLNIAMAAFLNELKNGKMAN